MQQPQPLTCEHELGHILWGLIANMQALLPILSPCPLQHDLVAFPTKRWLCS